MPWFHGLEALSQGSLGLGPRGYRPGSARKPRPYYASAAVV
jgi:hypothetical protein